MRVMRVVSFIVGNCAVPAGQFCCRSASSKTTAKPSHLGLDSIVIGFYWDKQLRYAARVRAGFVPLTRRQVFDRIKPLETGMCPFVNLPEKDAGRWGQGLTAEKMKECVWVKPVIIAEVEFLEWTDADHLRHTKFAGLRDDKDPRALVRET
jgi:ATP-dependent DNA ligase